MLVMQQRTRRYASGRFSMVEDFMQTIVSMFDESGNALRPWAQVGFACHAFDLINEPKFEFVGSRGGFIQFHKADFTNPNDIARVIELRPSFLMGFPPCTDLAVSGARHFENKRNLDPLFQLKAACLFLTVPYVGSLLGVPWFAENPKSVISTIWRKPDYKFHPFQYGGYLPSNDVHPRWPQYIAPRDAYEKHTWLWAGNGFVMPPKMPVDPVTVQYENGVKGSQQFAKLGGKSSKTKQIRSETPRGFAFAVMLANVIPK